MLGDRPIPQGKVRWLADLSASLKAIDELGQDAPVAVRAMRPIVQQAHDAIDAAEAAAPGRAPTRAIYSEEAKRAGATVEIAIGDFLAWSSSQATSSRYGTLNRILFSKRKSDAPAAGGGADDKSKTGSAKDGEGQSAAGAASGSTPAAPQQPSQTAEGASDSHDAASAVKHATA